MAALDRCHAEVVRALENDRWHVSPRPFTLYTSRSNLFADISATRTDSTGTIIVAEVKCFGDPQQIMPDLYTSIGQYIVYKNALRQMKLDLPLFLALPTEAYYGVVIDIAGEIFVDLKINVIAIDLENERIDQWVQYD